MSAQTGASAEAASSAADPQPQSQSAVPAASAASSSSSSSAAAAAEAEAEHLDMSALNFSDCAGSESMDSDTDSSARLPPRRLLRAEAVLSRRRARFLLVVETLQDENNHHAILRTADSFGIQHVWVVKTPVEQKHRARKKKQLAEQAELLARGQAVDKHHTEKIISATSTVSMASGRWLTLRYFETTRECIDALRAEGRSIWVTSLSPSARRLDRDFLAPARGNSVPQKLAVVMGREIDGVSPEMCAAADLSVFLPMCGFSESYNVSVAAALVIQRLTDLCPTEGGEGDLDEAEKAQLRDTWYRHLSVKAPALYEEYVNYWLPRAKEIEACMRRLQAEEEAAGTDGGAASLASSAAAGASSLLRPLEELRMPKVNRKVRMRMEQEGQRAVTLPTKQPTPDPSSSPAASPTSAASPAPAQS